MKQFNFTYNTCFLFEKHLLFAHKYVQIVVSQYKVVLYVIYKIISFLWGR